MNITSGNAITDGEGFRYWFVGRIGSWCKQNGLPFDPEGVGLRNTDDIEIKWGVYEKGATRSEWASSSHKTGMSILIRGDSLFTFRETGGHGERREVRLRREGDYVIWREDGEHTWNMLEDSVFLTLRWQAR